MKSVRYTWSRWAPNPIEHVADDTMWGQPICGRRLSVERQTFGEAPTGIVPVCERCERKLKKMQDAERMDFATATTVAEVDGLERELIATIARVRKQFTPEVQYQILDQLNATAHDIEGEEFDRTHR